MSAPSGGESGVGPAREVSEAGRLITKLRRWWRNAIFPSTFQSTKIRNTCGKSIGRSGIEGMTGSNRDTGWILRRAGFFTSITTVRGFGSMSGLSRVRSRGSRGKAASENRHPHSLMRSESKRTAGSIHLKSFGERPGHFCIAAKGVNRIICMSGTYDPLSNAIAGRDGAWN